MDGRKDTNSDQALLTVIAVHRARSGVWANVTCNDRAFYIFTSGTTGLPGCGEESHASAHMPFMMYGFAGALNSGPNDRMYNVLPLWPFHGRYLVYGRWWR